MAHCLQQYRDEKLSTLRSELSPSDLPLAENLSDWIDVALSRYQDWKNRLNKSNWRLSLYHCSCLLNFVEIMMNLIVTSISGLLNSQFILYSAGDTFGTKQASHCFISALSQWQTTKFWIAIPPSGLVHRNTNLQRAVRWIKLIIIICHIVLHSDVIHLFGSAFFFIYILHRNTHVS